MIDKTSITGANLLKFDTVFKICFYDKNKKCNNVFKSKKR